MAARPGEVEGAGPDDGTAADLRPIVIHAALPDRPKSLLQRAAETLAVVTALGFLASATVNTLIFLRWDVSFLAVATSADVLMSGVQLLVYGGVVALSATFFAWTLLPQSETPRSNFVRRLVLGLAGLAAALWYLYVAYRALRYDFPHLHAEQVRDLGTAGFVFLVVGAIGAVAADAEAAQRAFPDQMRSLFSSRPFNIVPSGIVLAMLLAGSCALMLGGQMATSGFTSPVWYDKPGDPNCMPLRALWIGQSSIVASCPDTGEVRVVSRTSDGVVLRTAPDRPAALKSPPEPSKAH